ncbi:hypothetical protein L6164_020984 [Bauhinia variegata]|uniref:Uncharacterized protein n=1 Tax=Bauhinia variegata TaxID=167791 RepID=A0ACB9MWR4_BAUVA|nr:hypothetical protein L6164_020984 [Bauhinia variegata]
MMQHLHLIDNSVVGGSTSKVTYCASKLDSPVYCVVHATFLKKILKLLEAFGRTVYIVIFSNNVSQEHLLPSLDFTDLVLARQR